MGVSRSPAELASKFQVAAVKMSKVNPSAVGAAAQVYKTVGLVEAKRDVGGDLRMSNWGRKGVKLNVRYAVKGTSNASAVVSPTPIGVWSALSSGTVEHDIYPGQKRPGRKRRGGKKALLINGGFATRVTHPGAKGKRTWQRAKKIAEPRAMRVFAVRHRSALQETFR